MKKKIGRVRVRTPGPAPASTPAPSVLKRVGRVVRSEIPGTSRGHRQCDHCEGRTMYGNWLHSKGCPYTAVIWKGENREDWPCPFQCRPLQLPTCVTHSWDCTFWDSPFNARGDVGFDFARRPRDAG